MKRQQLLRQQARRGPGLGEREGGESWGQLGLEWARQERAPEEELELLEKKRKGQRGPQDHGDGTLSQARWAQEDVGGDGAGAGGRRENGEPGQHWKQCWE